MGVRKPARIVQWARRNSEAKRPYLFWTDYGVFPPRSKRVPCDLLGATTTETRAALVAQYRKREIAAQHDAFTGKPPLSREQESRGAGGFDQPLLAAVNEYLHDMGTRVEARQGARGLRVGIEASTAVRAGNSIKALTRWLEARRLTVLRCGDIHAKHLEDLKQWLGTSREVSPHTVNLDLRNIKGMFRWLNLQRPPRLRDYDILAHALRPIPAQAPMPVAYTREQMQGFYRHALVRNALVASLIRFLACTGCRRGEAADLRWQDVDLVAGRIRFHAQKTGRVRIFPLIGAPEGDVARGLLQWLRSIPRGNDSDPVFSFFPADAWKAVVDASGIDVMPQGLRSTFTSYAASQGVPATVCALWQGHSPQVADRFYRGQILDGEKAASIEAAMGFEFPTLPDKA